MNTSELAALAERIIHELEKTIVGKRQSLHRSVLAMLCNGHVLLEDIPGVGKTTLAKALSKAVGGDFHRIQFTPDLLPSDITGSSIFQQKSGEFEFRPGPLFAHVVLVDEINRATPKTQSSLLEAMEERQVTVDGETRKLPIPFFVLATQNNLEMTGTYPLPEAQLDRFFARISIGYPDREAELDILRSQQVVHPLELVQTISSPQEMSDAQAAVRQVHLSDAVRGYLVDIVRATREHSLLTVGASPRGSLYLSLAAQAEAAMSGEDYVRPDHVKAVAAMILGHRVISRGEVRARGMTHEDIITQILQQVPVPMPVA